MLDINYVVAIAIATFAIGYIIAILMPTKCPYEKDEDPKTKNVGYKAYGSAERQTPPVSLQEILAALENPGLTAAIDKRIEEVRAECKAEPQSVVVKFSDCESRDLFFVLERKGYGTRDAQTSTDAFEYIGNARAYITDRLRSNPRLYHRIEVIRAVRLPDGRYVGYEPLLREIKLERIP